MSNKQENTRLFGDFPPISTDEWEEKIITDLKGADYEKKLVWKTIEGLKVHPYYRKENLEELKYLNTLPGQSPYTRGTNTDGNNWEIRQDIWIEDVKNANQKALSILERGVTSLGFNDAKTNGERKLRNQTDLSTLLSEIFFDCIDINFSVGYKASDLLKWLKEEAVNRGIDVNKFRGSVDFDPLTHLTLTGGWNKNEESDFNLLKEILLFAKENLPNFRIISVNGSIFNNAGASVVQELGLSLAMAVEYLDKLTDKGLSVENITERLQFNMGIGSNYFMEIAKLRAIRTLWDKIVEANIPGYKPTNDLFINSVTSSWNQTIYDPYVNVLRTTTEAMSAILGGTNSLSVSPYDVSFKKTTDFSERIARNIQIILKEEAYFDKVVDPAAGSYYIESLTDSIISESWKLFLNIEEHGGYLEALKSGLIQDIIEKTANERKKMIASRREVLLGTNQFPNSGEFVEKDIIKNIAFSEIKTIGSVVVPIRKFRGATEFENLRLATEKHHKRPIVFLLTIGNLTMRKARAGFSSNFFACAGYDVVDNLGFASVDEGVKAAIKAKADIVVICSSDDEYAELAPEIFNQLKNKAIVVVAGAPACMEDLKQKGLEHFIHIRTDVLESLKEFHRQLGIK